MASVECHDVAVRYGRVSEQPAVAGFTASVPPGQWLGLIGPNGAGKSSLLKAVVGIVKHTGTITVGGPSGSARLGTRSPLGNRLLRRRKGALLSGRYAYRRTSLAERRRKRAATVAYVPQEPLLPPDMTTFEYVLLGRSPYVSYLGSETRHDRATARSVLDRLELVDLAERPLAQLSGGERQRAVIARALATEAPVLVLDEPTSALDIGHQQQALELVASLRCQQDLTVLCALHDLTLAGSYCDRLVLMHEGETVADGPPADVLQADTLAEIYGVRVTIHHEPDGTIVVIPKRSTP